MIDSTLGLASLGILAFSARAWFRGIQQVDLPADRTPFVVAWAAAALLGLRALWGEPGWIGGTAALLGLGASAFFLLTVAISRQRAGEDAIRVGDRIPAFHALDEKGGTFDSQDLAGHLVLIKFFRGHW